MMILRKNRGLWTVWRKCLLNTKSVNCDSFPVVAALDLSKKLFKIGTTQDNYMNIKSHKQLQKRISRFLTNWGTAKMAVAPPCSHGYIDLANRHLEILSDTLEVLFCIRKLCILCSKREGVVKPRWATIDGFHMTSRRPVWCIKQWNGGRVGVQ